MTIKTVNIQFAATSEEEPMAVVRDANNNELLSVWNGNAASELYYQLIRRNMGTDYSEKSEVIKRET